MDGSLNRQTKGTFHSTCPAHATEATGSRHSFEEQSSFLVISQLVPSIKHYYTFLRVPYPSLAKRLSKFYSVFYCKCKGAREISFETMFCSKTAFHSVLLEGLN